MRNLTEQRSRTMRAVKSKNTAPEMLVRKTIFNMGYRYSLHHTELPGTPDLVFRSQKKVIFVHGCFWHGHSCPRGARLPKQNAEYWRKKIERNMQRDGAHLMKLQTMGWKSLVVWECELKNLTQLKKSLLNFLAPMNLSK